ncbi:MAG: glycogen/starch/alpha-glucan phosphorylase [Clostridiales Family XIII bacterium]|nr:glycogen/starch/alpha-glucan phosphorylase [Clostridiales Family XIII bacterium]
MAKPMFSENVDKEYIKKEIQKKLKRGQGVSLSEATKEEIYKAVSMTVRDVIMERWSDANARVRERGAKRLYYLSAEFLMGRALVNNMINLHLAGEYREALEELGLSLSDIEEQESDPGLGNGGLGRLAACFLDALSTLDLPATGCCIRYEHGLFRQRIENGEQREDDDNWLENGNVWEVERPEETVEVRYGGRIDEVWTETGLRVEHSDYTPVSAVPYDMPVVGYESAMPATLRMWSARAKTEIDMDSFNRGDYVAAASASALVESISQVLYPEDNHEQGRLLRLKQFYFFTSASMQYMVHRHKKRGLDLHDLPERYTVQINDTHPTLAIPELIRILIDDEEMQWDEAFEITSRMFNYTNHTIMREALERWNEDMLKSLLPRVYRIITEIDKKFRDRVWAKWPGDIARLNELAIIGGGEIRMASLCIAVVSHVNGVSQLHGEIIRTRTFRDFYILYPDKFLGITNGITHRRWLAKSNEGLTALISSRIGEGFLRDWREMERVQELVSDEGFLEEFAAVKRANKEKLAEHLYKVQGAEIDPGSVFDVQAKRLHEYKRQLLKALHILHLYFEIKDAKTRGGGDEFGGAGQSGLSVVPSTFIFAAKAAPGYYMAKEIIRLILAIGDLVNNDPDTKDILKVVFIENYSVSEAEALIPATDVSEQLSTAGLEASGTGNMKFMLNGALTIGTMDGANIEIAEAVGDDNIFIFGADAYEIERMEREGSYRARGVYESDARVRRVVDALTDGTLPVMNGRQFHDLAGALLDDAGSRADRYFLLYDFASYADVYSHMMDVYSGAASGESGGSSVLPSKDWTRRAASNTAAAGRFFADRTVEEYNSLVWHLEEVGADE